MINKFGVVFVGILAAACAFGHDQDAFDAHVSDFRLLTSKKVQKDVGLSTKQLTEMNKYADKNRADMNAYRQQVAQKGQDPSRIPDSDPVLQKAFYDLKNSVLYVLTPPQLKRLRELTLQSVGILGMTDGAVAKRIGLSAAQLTKVQTIFREGAKRENKIRETAYQKVVAPYQHYKPKDQKDAQAISTKIRSAYEAELKKHESEVKNAALQTKKELDAVVNKKQYEAFAALEGKKFTG